MHRISVSAAGLLAFILVAAMPRIASSHDAPLTYDRVRLDVSAAEDVENDVLVAVLYHQREGQSPAAVADEVNKAIAWGVQRAREAPGVSVQTLQYDQRPVYRQQSLSGWRARQSLRLESRDATVLGELIGELQERLSVQSMSYEISPERRTEVEDRLIARALAAFRRRADLVAGELGRPDYRIVSLEIATASPGPEPVRMRAMAAEAASVAPPTVAPGVQTVTVRVAATVELGVTQ